MVSIEQAKASMDKEIEEYHKSGIEIDIDLSKSFYFHLQHDNEIVGIHNLSPKFRNQTLRSLLSVGYGSERDLPSQSDRNPGGSNGSSPGSSNEETDESNAEEWSQVFTKDGHFRIDQILPLIPQAAQLSKKGDLALFRQNLKFARLALTYYNKEHKDAPYELVMPIMASPFRAFGHHYLTHGNFFAKRKKLNSTPTDSSTELFFAEMLACYPEGMEPVQKCCILKPNPDVCSPGAVKHFPPVWVFHPEDIVRCMCNISSNCDLSDSDDD